MLRKTVLIVNQKSEEGINKLNFAQLSNSVCFVTLEGFKISEKRLN
jgi:hypothetical protein